MTGVGRAAANFSPLVNAVRGVKSIVAPFTESGARVIAEDAVRRMAADPDRAADRLLQEQNVGNLTPAQQTGEPGLMALERGYAERNPRLRESLEAQTAASRATLGDEARAPAQARTARLTSSHGCGQQWRGSGAKSGGGPLPGPSWPPGRICPAARICRPPPTGCQVRARRAPAAPRASPAGPGTS